jgi:hypothetical protein
MLMHINETPVMMRIVPHGVSNPVFTETGKTGDFSDLV